jgi:hypothetical protein
MGNAPQFLATASLAVLEKRKEDEESSARIESSIGMQQTGKKT